MNLQLSSYESKRRTAQNYEATARAAMKRAMYAIAKGDRKTSQQWLEMAAMKLAQAEALTG